jgi:hypothetical protein
MLQVVRDYQQGKPPLGLERPLDYSRIRALAIRLRNERD